MWCTCDLNLPRVSLPEPPQVGQVKVLSPLSNLGGNDTKSEFLVESGELNSSGFDEDFIFRLQHNFSTFVMEFQTSTIAKLHNFTNCENNAMTTAWARGIFTKGDRDIWLASLYTRARRDMKFEYKKINYISPSAHIFTLVII